MGLSGNMGVPYFGGPCNKDPTIWSTILGSPIFGNPHVCPADRAKGLGVGLGFIEIEVS